MNNKQLGYENESLVMNYYQNNGYNLIEKNFTIKGGEIDLLMQNGRELVLIEVKTINYIDELDGYITPNKVRFLQKTLDSFFLNYDENNFDNIRMDVVFVKGGEIFDIFEDITNN